MKKLFLFALVATMFAACATDATEDVAVGIETPETLTVSFEGDSRIQLQNGKTVWTAGDLLSVFYRSNANQKWQYQGDTGERSGSIARVANAEATQELSNIVVVYPYNENYYINPRTYNVQASLPATQTYKADSYGIDGNIMISSSEYKHFALKSVCGWLKLQLTGNGETIKSITLKGNNGEQVAGEIYINSADASCELALNSSILGDDSEVGGSIFEDGTILKEVTLDCGTGVTLGSTAKTFYIALPPQTFKKGLTIDIEATDGSKMSKSTSNAVIIERNAIQPMSAFGYEGVIPEVFELAYTTNDGQPLDPYTTEGFGSNFVENIYDAATGKGALKFDGRITTIPENAFVSCTNLTWINLPLTVTKIGNGAFQGCSNMEELTLPSSITSLGAAFENCGGKLYVNCKLNYGGSYNSGRFYKALFTDVVIAEGIDRIGEYVFAYCEKLTNITIPNSVTNINKGAFLNCTSLTNITLPNNLTYINESLFCRCSNLASIVIPDKVTSIGQYAFDDCASLSSIVIPPSLKTIYNSAFGDCKGIQRVYISDLSAWCKISFDTYGSNPLYGDKYKAGYAKLYLQGEEVINLVIPNDILKVNSCAFEGCGSITNVTISGRVTSIGDNAFARCGNIESVTIGDSVATIGATAFDECDKLKVLTLGSGVMTIGDEAFSFEQQPSSLETVYCKATTPPSTATHLFYCHPYGESYSSRSYCTIYVPQASVEAYKSAEYWSGYADRIVGYDF